MNLLTADFIVQWTLWLLACFSLVTWTIILLKSWLYIHLSLQNKAFARKFWQAGSLEDARRLAEQGSGMLATVSQRGFDVLGTPAEEGVLLKSTHQERKLLTRAMREAVLNQQRRLDGGLIILASVGSTAPFVGLFGTVWGIMLALRDISASGSASLEVVAGPIGEALVATAVGIATAVPAVLAYNYALRQSRRYGAELENFATDFIEMQAE
jgi:biopolymer transport protein ExbB